MQETARRHHSKSNESTHMDFTHRPNQQMRLKSIPEPLMKIPPSKKHRQGNTFLTPPTPNSIVWKSHDSEFQSALANRIEICKHGKSNLKCVPEIILLAYKPICKNHQLFLLFVPHVRCIYDLEYIVVVPLCQLLRK